MELRSNAIPDGGTIATTHAEPSCGGENVAPDLAWSGAPEETRSYAITCYDPDAPTGSGFWHWVAFDVPADVTSLDRGADVPGREWVNDYGYDGYGGPCPPPGPAHRYVFTVHALDVAALDVSDDATCAGARFQVMAHSIAQASFTGMFGQPE